MRIVPSGLLVALLVSCAAGSSSSPDGASPKPGPASCEEPRSAAQAELRAAIDANVACNVDSDCTTVLFAAQCFSYCAVSANVNGRSAIDAARTRVDATSCAAFRGRGCSFTPAPCPPPSPPACVEGRCI